MLTNALIDRIANLFYNIDKSVRVDLSNDRIADERDYVSRLVTHFNYPFGLVNVYKLTKPLLKSISFSKTLPSSQEQLFGCDSIIIFQKRDRVKIGVFEAKWPRVFKNPQYRWDYAQQGSRDSHFSSQIIRQRSWSDLATIWEMFFYEEEPGIIASPFDRYGSTCILHEYADLHLNGFLDNRRIWNNQDLRDLISFAQASSVGGNNETNIRMIIKKMLKDTTKTHTIQPNANTFVLKNTSNEEASVPVVNFDKHVNAQNRFISSFMEKVGLSNFVFFKREEVE